MEKGLIGVQMSTIAPSKIPNFDAFEAMKKMIAFNREERAKMGLAGRSHMEDVFDKKKVVASTIKHLF